MHFVFILLFNPHFANCYLANIKGLFGLHLALLGGDKAWGSHFVGFDQWIALSNCSSNCFVVISMEGGCLGRSLGELLNLLLDWVKGDDQLVLSVFLELAKA